MAFTSGLGNMDSIGAYTNYFGSLPHGTVYFDPMGTRGVQIDKKTSQQVISGVNPVIKAMGTTSGGAGTAGYAMVPVFVDPRVVDRTRKQTPLVNILPRVSNMGMTADYNVITAKGGAITAAEDATLTETNTTYDRASTSIKSLYAIGRVTGQAIAAVPPYTTDSMTGGTNAVGDAGFNNSYASNALQMEVLVKTREIKELEEGLILMGNATTSVYGGANGTEFDGLTVLQSTTNKVDKNTSAVALSDLDLALQYAYDDGGFPNIGVCDSSTYSDILKLLSERIGYLNSQYETEFGFTAIKYNSMVGQVTIIPSRFMSTTTGSKAIYFFDTSVIEVRVLQDLTYEELAKTNDSKKFMLKEYLTVINRATAFCSFVGEIA